jgi:hypothetical protein
VSVGPEFGWTCPECGTYVTSMVVLKKTVVPVSVEDVEDAPYMEDLRAKILATFNLTEADVDAFDAVERASGYTAAREQYKREHAEFVAMLRTLRESIENLSTTTILSVAMKQVLELTIHNASGYEWEDGCHYDLNDPVTLRDEAGLPCPHESPDDDAISRNSVLKILLKLGETV